MGRDIDIAGAARDLVGLDVDLLVCREREVETPVEQDTSLKAVVPAATRNNCISRL
jgi:hypothetical protein